MTDFFDTLSLYGAVAEGLRILGYGGLALFVLALVVHSITTRA